MAGFTGALVGICIAPARQAAMDSREEVEVIAGQGLVGDRYLSSGRETHLAAITLIEREALEGLRRDYEIELSHAECRRNLLVEGTPLNHLVGVEFQVGGVRLRGHELCEPCSYLQRLTDKNVVHGLRHRGGLRGSVIQRYVASWGFRFCPK